MKIVEGTARNMGIAVEGVNDKELEEEAHEAALEEAREEREAAKEAAETEAVEQEETKSEE